MVENSLSHRIQHFPSEVDHLNPSLTAEHISSLSSPMQARSDFSIPHNPPVAEVPIPDSHEFSSQTSHHNRESGEIFVPSDSAGPDVESANSTHSKAIELLSNASTPSQNPTRDEDSAYAEQKILLLLRQSLQPFSDRLDPFAQLPTRLTRFQEHLVSFYLLYYPKVTYGLSPRLQPHPVATNFAIALNTPACFQVALARSALYRLNLQKFANEKERGDLEVARIRHQGQAIRMVRKLTLDMETDPNLESLTASGKNKRALAKMRDLRPKKKNYDALIASMISLGTLDRRIGADSTASMHFSAVRRLLRAAGGPLGLNSVLLSRVMVHFECIYGTTTGSYVWDREDFSPLLEEVNVFFDQIWELWSKLSEVSSYGSSRRSSADTNMVIASPAATGVTIGTPSSDEQVDNQLRRTTSISSTFSQTPSHPVQAFALPPDSTLRLSLTRPLPVAEEDEEPTPQQRSNLIFQLTCLLTLAHVVTDHLVASSSSSSTTSDTPSPTLTGSSGHTNDSPSVFATATSSTDLSNLQTYLAPLFSNVENAKLSRQPCNNHMWLLQVFDHSSTHSRRIWRAAAFVWVLRHVGWRTQEMVKEWLAGFLSGEILDLDDEEDATTGTKVKRAPMRLNAFHFSYAS